MNLFKSEIKQISFFQRFRDGAQPRVRDVMRGGEGHHPARRAAPARDAQAQPHPGAAQVAGAKGRLIPWLPDGKI